MKRRSQPKTSKVKDSYARKRASGRMMYGPTSHAKTHFRIGERTSRLKHRKMSIDHSIFED